MAVTAPMDGTLALSTEHPGTAFEPALDVRSVCADQDSELACRYDGSGAEPSELSLAVTAGQTYYGVVDGAAAWAGSTFERSLILYPDACGNNVVEGIAVCDDNNTTDGAGCDSNCTPTACGNDIVTGGEACDDGSSNSDTAPDARRSDCTPARCGDGVQDTGEACDDGDLIAGNGCEHDCTASPGCGDGVRQAFEDCDDGGTTPGDGCGAACAFDGSCALALDASANINGAHLFGSTVGLLDTIEASCGGTGSGEQVHAVTPTAGGTRTAATDNPGTDFDTVLVVRGDCGEPASAIACDDDGGAGSQSRASFAVTAGETYYVVVQGFATSEGSFELSLTQP